MRRYVLGFLVSPSLEHVLLIKKARPEWQAGLLNGIGGNVEPAEFLDPKRAMVREFDEETPWKIEYDQWNHYADMDLRGQWLVHVYFSYSARLSDADTFDELLRWNAREGVDEPLSLIRVVALLPALYCISNLPGLIGFIKDYKPGRLPIEIRY